jgi:predicted TIM-barrel fold metal-dependent hydrolase
VIHASNTMQTPNRNHRVNRRTMFKGAALAVAALRGEALQVATAAEEPPTIAAGDGIIDTHVYLSRWPYRRVHGDETPELVRQLKQRGVTSAWAGSFDALLHRDIGAVNERLVSECAGQRDFQLLPFGAVNPTLPDWEEDLRRCDEVYHMPGIRLHPDFHGYKLDDARFQRLFDLAIQRRLIVQIGLGMEDPRLQPPLAMLPPVDPLPLFDLLPKFPGARVVLLNYWRSFRTNRVLQARLGSLPQLSFDTATIERVAGIAEVIEAMPSLRLIFGSYAPYYNFGSSVQKLHESALAPDPLAAISRGHAASLLHPA